MKVTVTEPNRRGISKDTIPWIEEHPSVKLWMSVIKANKIRFRYAYGLKCLLKGIGKSPEQLLVDIKADKKADSNVTSLSVKAYIGDLASRGSARFQVSALRSFCTTHEAELRLNGLKVKVPRTREKPYLTWNEANRIITETKPPYRAIFDFLLWSGLGLDEFAEIQTSPNIQSEIARQMSDETKPYVRINLRPRKSNTDTYFVLVPRTHVPAFPVLTRSYGNTRGNQLVAGLDLEQNWWRARHRLGIEIIGMGPHTLRSVFRSQCGLLGVADTVAEFQMGHGGRDKYGYAREVSDENYIAKELGKLWNATAPVTDNRIASLEERLRNTEENLRSSEVVNKTLAKSLGEFAARLDALTKTKT